MAHGQIPDSKSNEVSMASNWLGLLILYVKSVALCSIAFHQMHHRE